MRRLAFAAAALFALAAGAYLFWPQPAPSDPEPVVQATGPVHTVIGHTIEDRSIDAYTYGSGSTRLLFVGGIHGGYEWNATVLAYEYKAYLDANPESVPANLSVTIIPNLNADGTYKIVGKEGVFTADDVPSNLDTAPGRLNADGVDLNRNFACHWQPEATWRNTPVGAGSGPFSEPESAALRDYIAQIQPAAVVFWHSQSGSVYASQCDGEPLPEDIEIMNVYADAAGYTAVESFDAYPVTGDSEGWLASIGIPAITVELTTHTVIEWEKNLRGIDALLSYYAAR